MTVANRTGVLGSIADTFGAHNISVKSVIQRGAGAADAREALPEVPLLFIVYETERSTLNEALAEISGKDIVLSVDNILRVED
jgi:homoserine dehydrogenase